MKIFIENTIILFKFIEYDIFLEAFDQSIVSGLSLSYFYKRIEFKKSEIIKILNDDNFECNKCSHDVLAYQFGIDFSPDLYEFSLDGSTNIPFEIDSKTGSLFYLLI